jgi:hypothetical protein
MLFASRAARHGLPAIVIAIVSVSGYSAFAQLPQAKLFAVYPMGAQQGVPTEVTLANGTDLDEAARLIFNHPGIKAEQKTVDANGQKTPVANTFIVSVDASVPEGVYEVRSLGRFGASNPRSFVVGSRPEVNETEPNNTREQSMPIEWNTTVNARTDPSGFDYFKLTGKAGQRLIAVCVASRIDSKARPEVELYDSSGRRMAAAGWRRFQDVVLDVPLPADGDYYLRVNDQLYGGSNDHFYRLSVTTGPYIDFALPPSGIPGSNTQITLFGRNLPGGQPAGVSVNGRPLEKVAVSVPFPADIETTQVADNLLNAQGSLDAFTFVWKSPVGNSNPITLFQTTLPVVLEQEPNDTPAQAQKITVPSEIAGQFQVRGDFDFFTFEAKAKDVYWIEAFADRLGTLADPYVTLDRINKDDQGNETVQRITAQDDTGTNLVPNFFETLNDDPAFQFVVPADGTYRVSIRDRYYESRGDARLVYRLVIRKETPDFRVVVVPEAPQPANNNNPVAATYPTNLRKGENLSCRVVAFRTDGFNGTIDVTAENLPPGITCKGTSIGPGQTNSTIVFSAAEDAADGTFGFAKIVAKARVDDNAKVKALMDAKAALKPAQDALVKPQQDATQADEQEKKLAEARKAAETKFAADAEAAKKAADAKAVADKKVTDTAAAHKAATDKLAAAKVELDKDKEKPELKEAVAAAEKLVAETDAAAKAAAAEKVTADKAAADTANTLKASEQAKNKAVADHEAAIAKRKAAHDALAAAQKRIADAEAAIKLALAEQEAAARNVTHVARAATMVWDTNAQQTSPISRLSRGLCLAITPELHPFQISTEVFRVEANHNRQILVPVKIAKRNGFDDNVNITIVGAPQNAQVENKAINKGSNDGLFRIFLPNNVPVGTYTLYLKGQANVQYRRRPELADRAKAALDQAIAAATQAQEALTKANAEKDAAVKKAAEADAALKKAMADKDAAAKRVADTAEAVKKATEAKAKAETEADKESTAKALEVAAAEAKKATEELANAEKALADATAASKAAADAKTKAEADAKAADDKNKAAAADKAAKEKALNDTNNATKANQVNLSVPSTPIVITVRPNAVNVTTAPANGGTVKQGDKLEVKVTIQRVNNFAGPVTLEFVPPPNVTGLMADKVIIPADKTEGVITINVAADATVGPIANAVIRASGELEGAMAASDGAVAINVSK